MHADKHRIKGSRRTLAFLALCLLCLSASLRVRAAEAPARAVVDETGRTVQVPARVERIVSLAPNLTEMIYALGLEERLVGVTTVCDFPPAARAKPKVGDVIDPSLERIVELKPDLVLGTPAGNRRETADALERLGVPVYGIDPHSVNDIFTSIRHVAELVGVPEAGQELAARLEARLAALPAPQGSPTRPRVLFVVWLEPLVTVGGNTFLNDVLERAGADSITANLSQGWPQLSVEEVLERDPDYLVVPRTPILEARLAELARRPPWQRLRAVQQNRIVWVEEAVLRPGPRIVEAIEELARALHPEAFGREVAGK